VSFRRRITLVSAAAVAIAVILASLLVYVLTSNQLHSQVDQQLQNRSREAARLQRLFAVGALKVGPNGAASLDLNGGGQFVIAAKEAEGQLSSAGDESGAASRSDAGRQPRRSSSSEGLTQVNRRPGSLFGRLPPNPDQVRGYQQVIAAGGRVLARSIPNVTLPVDPRTLVLAGSGGAPFYRDVIVQTRPCWAVSWPARWSSR
jgi:hypothetical protein